MTVAAGERVIAINAAANRDPARWERPHELDPDRPRLWGHLAFNVGPRHCVGVAPRPDGGDRGRRRTVACVPGPGPRRGATADAVTPMGFVSRAWRPVQLAHSPIAQATARLRVSDGPAWAGSVPGRGSGADCGGLARLVDPRPGQALDPTGAAEHDRRRGQGQRSAVVASAQRRRCSVPIQFGKRLVSTVWMTVSPSTA